MRMSGFYYINVYSYMRDDSENSFTFGGVGTGHQESSIAEWFLCCLIFLIHSIADEGDFVGY